MIWFIAVISILGVISIIQELILNSELKRRVGILESIICKDGHDFWEEPTRTTQGKLVWHCTRCYHQQELSESERIGYLRERSLD